jgi:hypothetical protein
MTPATVELDRNLRNLATMAALPGTTDEQRTECMRLWCQLREAARTYAVLDCADELARFMTFDDALAFWKVAPRRYGRNSVVYVVNHDKVTERNWAGLSDEEWELLEQAKDERKEI